jgi:ribonuclease HI
LDSPVRALSAEFGLEPAKVVFSNKVARLRAREMRSGVIARAIGEHQGEEDVLPWRAVEHGDGLRVEPYQPGPESILVLKRAVTTSFETDLLLFTDGSGLPTGHAKAAVVAYRGEMPSEGTEVFRTTEMLPVGRCASDAEATAILLGLEKVGLPRDLGYKRIHLFSDSRVCLDYLRKTPKEGPLAYLNCRARTAIDRGIPDVICRWIPAHKGLRGNTEADELARISATDKVSSPVGSPSHMFQNLEITTDRQAAWVSWFKEKLHTYTRLPTRRMKRLEGLSREEETLIAKLRMDKGWSGAGEFTNSKQSCPACPEDLSGAHLVSCPALDLNRPARWRSVMRDSNVSHFVDWIRINPALTTLCPRQTVGGVDLQDLNHISVEMRKRSWARFTCTGCASEFAGTNKARHARICKCVRQVVTPAASGVRGRCRWCDKEYARNNVLRHERNCAKRVRPLRTGGLCAGCGKIFARLGAHERGGSCTGSRS